MHTITTSPRNNTIIIHIMMQDSIYLWVKKDKDLLGNNQYLLRKFTIQMKCIEYNEYKRPVALNL